MALATPARAQIAAPPSPSGRPSPLAAHRRAEHALIVGDWLLYPTAFAGGIYDSNVDQSGPHPRSSFGLRLVPSLLAQRTTGISKTTLYGMADTRLYTNAGSDNVNTLAARVGGIEDYQPAPDWVFRLHGDYTRQQDLFSTFGIDHGVTTLNPTGIGVAPTRQPLAYNQMAGSVSAEKRFSRAFLSVGGTVVDLTYDQSPLGGPSPSGVVYKGISRGGVWLTPDIYLFVQGSLDSRHYDTSALSSSGYRTVGGLGSNQIGLFRGEIYGGYQAEDYNSAQIGTVGSSVYGGRLYYYPLPELTLRAAVDRTLGASLLSTTSTSPGTSTRVTSVLGQASYSLMPEWTASGRAGYIRTSYGDSARRDDAWTLGGTLTYSIWQSFGLTLDYQHLELSSNVANEAFSRDVVTFGISYKY